MAAPPSYWCSGRGAAAWLRQEESMPHMKEERQQPPPPSRGNTEIAQGENQVPKARQPHERDESADSQAAENSSMQRIGSLAHDDVVEGQQDTSKSRELDATYHRLREESDPAPVDKVNRRQRSG
jgi:hypothetical protein